MVVSQMKALLINRKQNIFFIIGIVIILLIWLGISLVNENIFFPSIKDVSIDLYNLITEWNNLFIILLTIIKVVILIIVSFVISIVLAVISYKFMSFRSIISPMIAIMRSTPVASVILVLILLVGSKIAPFIISLLVIIPIAYENIYSAFMGIQSELIDETRLVSNINLKIILTLYIPITFNYLLSSLLTCFGLTLKVLVMSEVLTQGNMTIGGKIQIAKSTIDITRVFSWSIVLVVIVLIVEMIIKRINKKIQN